MKIFLPIAIGIVAAVCVVTLIIALFGDYEVRDTKNFMSKNEK